MLAVISSPRDTVPDKYPVFSTHLLLTTLPLQKVKSPLQAKMSTDPNLNKLHDDLFEIGLQNRREVVGNAYVDAALQNGSSDFAYPGQQLVTE